MVGVPNNWAFALADFNAVTAASASGCKPLLQGVIVECPFATPIMGLLMKSSSL
jgi:hypothetical protein